MRQCLNNRCLKIIYRLPWPQPLPSDLSAQAHSTKHKVIISFTCASLNLRWALKGQLEAFWSENVPDAGTTIFWDITMWELERTLTKWALISSDLMLINIHIEVRWSESRKGQNKAMGLCLIKIQQGLKEQKSASNWCPSFEAVWNCFKMPQDAPKLTVLQCTVETPIQMKLGCCVKRK